MTDRALSRRAFLKTVGVATFGVGLAACQPIPPLADDEAAMGEVTAAQVTDPESLKAFVLGAKAHIEAITDMNVGARLREDLKTEGDWKSGSTFLIIFLKTGEPFIHGNDREAESKNLLYVEDERGALVVQELFAAADQGGGFVEYYDDGLKTAYAVEYTSGITSRKFVLVGGYSQDVSHVEIEIADLPKPPVTASEVVDRETLIAFVEAAAEAYRTAVMSEGYSALTGVRNAFRVEGGDWKAGSIYLYVVSGGGVTLFHGSEPFREGKRTDMTRTDSKGVRFAELLIGVARREGKSFLRYHYDNPAIEGDEETGSPKLGYAVSFPVPNSEQRAVVGSGIYIDEDEE
ncbi:MAG: twin-arginine translocation signal domain-containing protein [Caldilineaceae bacterium SB0661_bin_32]|uniref:Twin-arginine translocation signal domain-containing protein n=1 Tax=Caldilineaceae bacterium SB0661_bin_32 TaxID=2605255 RepID=A0A6B1DC75_9CHLR|nr:twin-arginine translocation signal domain-containing protein [Caldilineaceae bacterium SB0661_bin_32]